jgi:hypothetical protein
MNEATGLSNRPFRLFIDNLLPCSMLYTIRLQSIWLMKPKSLRMVHAVASDLSMLMYSSLLIPFCNKILAFHFF